MTFTYGTRSLAKLNTCHPVLQGIAHKALEFSPYDFTITHGWRNQEEQDYLYSIGLSKTPYPKSAHNHTKEPTDEDTYGISDALDFAPYIKGGIDWNDTHIFAVVAGCFMAAASVMATGNRRGISVCWGGDWDSDGSTKDQSFMDWGHIELVWP